jgi:hypothetical protein
MISLLLKADSPTAKSIIADCYELDLYKTPHSRISRTIKERYNVVLSANLVAKAIKSVDTLAEIAELMGDNK